MKTINFIFISLFSLLFVCSCTKHDFDTYIPSQAKEHQYAKAFEQTFGNIAPGQAWGFSQPKAYTRSAMPNSNEWGTNNGAGYLNFPTPAAITAEEREAVLAVFNQKGKETYESIIDVDSFFVQQVYCGPNGNKMNELATTVDYKRERKVICWWPYQDELIETQCKPYDDIINNFNNGKYSGNAEQGCMLMYNSSTKLDFSFKTSQSGGQRIYKHWRMEKINGNYYVGFDHEAWRQAPANANEEDKRDYIYNDWIIKIVPGKDYVEPEDKVKEQGRIICEDLGGIGDFDFNDVVFDATIYESGKTEITVQAAGGELPISVAGKDISSVMGYMVNTIEDGPTHEPYTFVSDYTYNSLIDIPILVFHRDAAHHMYVTELKAEMGSAPQKICVPTTFKWCKEHNEHSIDKSYKGFATWVNEGQEWYNTDTPEELIHRY
jgi:hypothetical protein